MNPPNLRKQQAVHGPMCNSCVHLVRAFCGKYQLTVEGNALCDSWESIYLKEPRQWAEP